MTPSAEQLPLLPIQPARQQTAGGALLLHAPAKLNLNLLAGSPREDGFHPLDSYVAQVTFYDRILLRPRDDDRMTFACDGADCGPAEQNLAMRAAHALADETGRRGVAIELTKRIPPGKGLGGGSSDAAAVLAGLNELWALALPPERLAELAAGLGSDVPLFLGPPIARMSGRGERLTPARTAPWVALLYLPGGSCSTPAVYRRFDELRAADPPSDPATRQLPPEVLAGSVSQWRSRLVNDLAKAALAVSPALADPRRCLAHAAGDAGVHVTGSGSAMFCLCESVDEARAIVARLPASAASATPGGLRSRYVLVQPIEA